MEEIKATVNSLIEEVTEGAVDGSSMEECDHLKDKLGITSLQYIVLALKLEERFGTAIITVDNITEIESVKDVYDRVHQTLNKD